MRPIHKSLNTGWTFAETEPNQYTHPAELHAQQLNWTAAIVPGTVAQACQKAKQWSFNTPFDFDSKDWWYQTTFNVDTETTSPLLNLQGLATLCDVWLNGQQILSSNNMFTGYQIDVSEFLVEQSNQLFLCFRSLNEQLAQRKPRPRWKTRLVSQQQLRWYRTTLLGRIPGWTPPVAAVGPWQPIFLANKTQPCDINLQTRIDNDTGIVNFHCHLPIDQKTGIKAQLQIDNHSTALDIEKTPHGYRLSGQLSVTNAIRWWPHTHGQAKLYTPTLSVSIQGDTQQHTLPAIGFKSIQLEQSDNRFQLFVNHQAVFCRGACWTINDIVSLQGDNNTLEQTLTLMRDAGANMIRIGGTMIYEQDLFYQLCDKLGIIVWQDFMFANMDYPIDDSAFHRTVKTELQQTLTRLSSHPCIGLYCGNSEIEQQGAMLGLAKSEWQNSLFTQLIPELCDTLHPGIPYISSTPTGNILPFHSNKNVTHYYGVGAYLRPVAELRQHDVKFTSECLGFSNLPVSKTRNQVLNGQLPVTHHPKWKERVPRDTAAGWDFEDVRDHYTQSLFNIELTQMRCFDTERYFMLSEITSGEIMSQVYSEWRSSHSQCSGALVWFLKDFWPGAGWGIIDSNGLPKACYYYLKRSWQPLNIHMTNESLNGYDIHINNETKKDFNGSIEFTLLNKNSTVIATTSRHVTIPAETTHSCNSDELLAGFFDVTYSYRFGPVKHSIVSAQLKNQQGEHISDCFAFPNAEIPYSNPDTRLTAIAKQIDENTFSLQLSSTHFLYAVNIEVDGYSTSNNFFHLLPDTTRFITMKKIHSGHKRYKGYVSAINLPEDTKIKVSHT